MLTDGHIRTLLSIDSIEELLKFLQRELHWPIDSADPEDATFLYDAEDLGLKPELAPKINKIYQIRPPSGDVPWGIFFIDFENKKLPVTILRRILNKLVVKKRAAPAVGSGWNAGDLLFMSTYGERVDGMREVAFAHFHEQAGDLPTLNVLQWDAQDTPAKLQTTYNDLRQNLGWPPNTADKEAWRKQWRQPFKHRIGHTITTAKALAEKLAELSRDIRDRVREILEAETERGPMTKLYKAFQSALIHDLKPADFADTFAQTVTYGLFSAAVSRRFPEEKGSKSLTTETIAQIVPETNPFLREVLETFLDVGGRKKGGIDFDELGVQDVVELLRSDETDMKAILEDFGNRRQGEDPVIHFYEDYLRAYNKELKVKRGVFYTPQPVVSYIVRSVDELLQTEFGLEDGLASTITWGEMSAKNADIEVPEGTPPDSPFVVILDPATGTATFLVEVIDVIHKHLQTKWNQDRAATLDLLRLPKTAAPQHANTFPDFWNAYVPDHLLKRIFGYELMMAPYAIAHMKVGLKLGETGYRFGSSQRVRIYLTNALEPASELQARLALDWEALAHEAMAVKAVKETQRFTVVIGNPPYSASISEPLWIVEALKPWKEGLNETKIDLNREEWKFIRLAQLLLDVAGQGILGMITNRDYLDGIAKRQMRSHLQQTFPNRITVDLNGDVKGNITDENVFEIQQGVAISLLSSRGEERHRHRSLVGTAAEKQRHLDVANGRPEWREISPVEPYFRWVAALPRDVSDNTEAEYGCGYPVNEAFAVYSSGIQTKSDQVTIDFDREALWNRITILDQTDAETARTRFALGADGRDWTVNGAKADLRRSGPSESHIATIHYRPFDFRFTYWTGVTKGFLAYPRREVMQHLVRRVNVGLIFNRQIVGNSISHFGVSKFATCHGMFYLGNKGQDYLAPLYRYPTEKEAAMGIGKEPNLSPAFLDALAGAIWRRFESDGSSAGPCGLFTEVAGAIPLVVGSSLSPEEVFHYIYGVLHSPAYRSRYAEFLKIDFPRIPLPGSAAVFAALIPLGEELVALHLMESLRLDQHMTTFIGATNPLVEKVSFARDAVWLDKAQTRGFQGVPEEVWNFHIGGYQVCEKWLKDRGPKGGKPGRILSPEDIDHYHRIVVALSETIGIMKEIDEVIDAHGGWPGAFAGPPAEAR